MAGRHRFRARLATLVAASVLVFQAVSPQLPVVRGVDPSGSPTPAASTSPDPSTSGTGGGASGPAVAVATTAATIVPYQAIDYRYQVVASGTGTGFEGVLLNDSTWSTGTAAFGSGGGCALEATVATAWPVNTDVLVRRHVPLPIGTTGVTIGIAIDNDVQVYWNGTLVGSNAHDGCPSLDSFVYPVADNQLSGGDNVLAVRGIDRGDQSLLDITVRGTLPSVANPERFLGQGANPHQNDPTGTQAEPVNTYSGNYTNSVTDLALPGRGLPFAFARTYNSVRSGTGGPLGPGWSHPYGASLVLNADGTVTFASEDGSAIPYRADGAGGFTGDAGVLSTLAPVAGGGYTLTRRDGLRYAFDAVGRLISETDRNGNSLAFAYSGSDLTTITDSIGRTVSLTVDAAHHITGLSDPIGRTVTYGHDVAGRLASVTDVRGGVTAYAYDAGGRLATITDQNGHVLVTNTYDADGRVVEQLDARGFHTTFTYDATAGTTTMTDARGGAWVDTYSGPALVARRDSLGNTTRYAYDTAFNRTSVTDPRANATTLTYDARGNLLTRTAPAPLGYVETFTYSAANDLLTARDRRGNTTTNTYDAAGNLTKATAPDGTFTTFTYDPQGLLLTATDPRGKMTAFGYDAQANRNRTTTPLGEVTTMTYDDAGRMLTIVDPRGNATGALPADYTTTFTYDAADHVLTVTDPLGNVTTTTYDPAGNRTSVKDANNHTTAYAHDPANHLASVTDPAAMVTAYTYDATGNLVSRLDANSHTTTYTYDLAGRLMTTTDPLAHAWTLTYDANGNITTRTDANGKLATFTYDVLNRLTGITYAATSTSPVTYAYDGNGNRTTMTDGAGTETYTYDSLDRLTSVTRGTDVFRYTYDAADGLTSRTYPDGTITTYAYDDDGRMVSASSGGTTTTYAYDPAGNPLAAATPDGFTALATYDRAARLLEIANVSSAGVLSRSTYALDPVGNRLSMTTTRDVQLYTYDALDRLTRVCYNLCSTGGGGGPAAAPTQNGAGTACQACGPGGIIPETSPTDGGPAANDVFTSWTYDQVGNRLTETNYLGTTTSTYDAADRLTGTSAPGGVVTNLTYDANGNELSAGTTTYAYDLADRIVSASVGATTESYTWSGDGIRLSAATGSQAAKTVRFVVDRAFALPQAVIERDGANRTLRRYVYGLDLLSQTTPNKGPYWYHHDGLGSVVNITSTAGSSLAWWEYQPFGLPRAFATTSQAPANSFLFTGEYRDAATALYHLRARQYDPGIGRFLAVDPKLPSIQGPYVSTYVYAMNNPGRLVDPSGRDTGGLCVSVQAGFILFGGEQICLVISGEGEIGIIGTTDYGLGTPSASATAGVQKSNATSIEDLAGPFGYAGGSGGEGIVGGFEGFTGIDRCGNPVTGGTLGAGVGVGPPLEGHGGQSQTDVLLNIDLGGLFGDTDAPCPASK